MWPANKPAFCNRDAISSSSSSSETPFFTSQPGADLVLMAISDLRRATFVRMKGGGKMSKKSDFEWRPGVQEKKIPPPFVTQG